MKITEQIKFEINFVKYTKFYIYIYRKREKKDYKINSLLIANLPPPKFPFRRKAAINQPNVERNDKSK